jgi:hypothetical protein
MLRMAKKKKKNLEIKFADKVKEVSKINIQTSKKEKNHYIMLIG